VIAEPGLTPTSPTTDVAPVLVTVEAPKTAKLTAVPIAGAVCAHALFREHTASSRTAAIKRQQERLPFAIVFSFPFDFRIPLTRLRPDNGSDRAGIFLLESNN
jgi:hypothetical protein